jgi:hypothetical protein
LFELVDKKAVMDMRERIAKGEHPRAEILNFVKAVPVGTVFEIHLLHRGEPLIASLQSFGMNVIVNELEPMHFRPFPSGDVFVNFISPSFTTNNVSECSPSLKINSPCELFFYF